MTSTDKFNGDPQHSFGHRVKKSTTSLDIDIYPVIHHLNAVTTLEQADIAFDAQADGVFLISHYRDDDALVPLAHQIKAKYPDKKVGLNFLSKGPQAALDAVDIAGLDMMWGDYCGVTSGEPEMLAHDLDVRNQEIGVKDIFASVAFKYQAEDTDPPLAARHAKIFGFIPTTSGAGTGEAPTVDKIKAMSAAVDGNLAVASGMTVENIGDYAPYLRYILVATGVSLDDHHFDFERLYRFIALAKNAKANHLITSELVAVAAKTDGGK